LNVSVSRIRLLVLFSPFFLLAAKSPSIWLLELTLPLIYRNIAFIDKEDSLKRYKNGI
jgi:hypothetical protein